MTEEPTLRTARYAGVLTNDPFARVMYGLEWAASWRDAAPMIVVLHVKCAGQYAEWELERDMLRSCLTDGVKAGEANMRMLVCEEGELHLRMEGDSCLGEHAVAYVTLPALGGLRALLADSDALVVPGSQDESDRTVAGLLEALGDTGGASGSWDV